MRKQETKANFKLYDVCLHKPYDLKLDPKENSESSLEESIKGKFKQKTHMQMRVEGQNHENN